MPNISNNPAKISKQSSISSFFKESPVNIKQNSIEKKKKLMQNNSQDPKIDIFLKNKSPEEKPVQEIINSFSQIIGDF